SPKEVAVVGAPTRKEIDLLAAHPAAAIIGDHATIVDEAAFAAAAGHRQAIELGDVERAADLDLVGVDRNGPEGGQGTLRDAGSPFVRVTRNPVAGPIAAAAAGGA